MNDELIMNNYLMILKSTIEVYIHGTLESSNDDVRSILSTGLDETLLHQAKTYDLMVEYGWYSVDNVKSSVVQNALDKLN